MEHHEALVVEENADGTFSHSFKKNETRAPQENEVAIKVSYSSLNYKDYLSLTGNKGVTRKFPHTPGIDAAGTIVKSNSKKFSFGEKVLVTGFDLGMNTSGGFQQYITISDDWVVSLKNLPLSLENAMAWGTAGFTAAQSVEKIANVVSPNTNLPVAVTGATGGVGSVAIMLLSKLGYEVNAFTQSNSSVALLQHWGAKKVVDLNEALTPENDKRPLLKPLYSAAIDTVGDKPLSYLLRSTGHRGVVTTCGMVAGISLNLTVFPFILRGVTLAGIDSAECPIASKRMLWEKIATDWTLPKLAEEHSVIPLSEVPEKLMLMKTGKSMARTVVEIP